ncbi:MAG: sugar transferase [Bacteroidales bacterium]|nr:sugar transferase [Bacteroidales bacterium]
MVKRCFDLLISVISVPFLLLIFGPIAILIKLEDGGPIFYSSNRLGRNGVPFKMFKFRTMVVDAPDIRLADGSTYNAKDDPRVTRIGRFLRETSLDETPQVLNIFTGKMSLIGPRPDITLNEKFLTEVKYNLCVKPGLTGYSQAYFRGESSWEEIIQHNRYYVDHLSLGFDMKIFIKTVFMVLRREKTYKRIESSK